MNRENVFEEMSKASLIVIPSIFEGFCNVLYESLYYNGNVLASDLEVLKENFEDSILYFNNNDVLDLTNKLEEALFFSDNSNIKLKKIIENQFSIIKSSDNYIRFYRDIIKNDE